MIERYGKQANKTETIYLGVDETFLYRTAVGPVDVRESLRIASGRPVVSYICRISPEKRPFLMLEIAKATRKRVPDISFIVVGDGPQIEEFRNMIKKISSRRRYILPDGRMIYGRLCGQRLKPYMLITGRTFPG